MKEKTVSIAGRVEPRHLCLTAQYISSLDLQPRSRSELVSITLKLFANHIRETYPDMEKELELGEGKSYLASLGLTWPGERSAREWSNVIASEVQEKFSEEQVEELIQLLQQKKSGKVETDSSDLLLDLEKELQAVDEKLRKKEQ